MKKEFSFDEHYSASKNISSLIISNTIVPCARKHVKKQCHCFSGGTGGGGGSYRLQVGGGGGEEGRGDGGGGRAPAEDQARRHFSGEKRTELNTSPPPPTPDHGNYPALGNKSGTWQSQACQSVPSPDGVKSELCDQSFLK